MPPSPKLKGRTFGSYTVIAKTDKRQCGKVLWECKCDCGATKLVTTGNLQFGRSVRCEQCGNDDRQGTSLGGLFKEYPQMWHQWNDMHRRCEQHNHKSYNNYGARGIKVCEDWKEFKAYCEWALDNGYSKLLTIERDNVDKGYEPNNVSFIPLHCQNLNKRKLK